MYHLLAKNSLLVLPWFKVIGSMVTRVCCLLDKSTIVNKSRSFSTMSLLFVRILSKRAVVEGSYLNINIATTSGSLSTGR